MAQRSAPKIRLLTLEEIHTVYHVYMIDDFGEMELKPFGRIEADFAAGKYEGYGLFEGKMIIAYALFVITDTGVALLDYLGVREDLRDQGYGTKTLQMLEPELTKYDMMIVDVSSCSVPFADLGAGLSQLGSGMGLEIRCQKAAIFEKMHRI